RQPCFRIDRRLVPGARPGARRQAPAALRRLLHGRVSDYPDRSRRQGRRSLAFAGRQPLNAAPMTDSKNLSGKLALVTGASRGIGAATAEALAEAGAHVILVARTGQALEQVEERIHEAGGSATIAPLDLTDGTSVSKLAAAIAERWERLDILVLNAGMLGSLTPVRDIDPKEYARVLTLNVGANQALIAAFDPLLKKAER